MARTESMRSARGLGRTESMRSTASASGGKRGSKSKSKSKSKKGRKRGGNDDDEEDDDEDAINAPGRGSFRRKYKPRRGDDAPAASAAASAWTPQRDAQGATFWYNAVTGEFRWDAPPGYGGANGAPPPPTPPGGFAIASALAPPVAVSSIGAFGSAPGGFGSFRGAPPMPPPAAAAPGPYGFGAYAVAAPAGNAGTQWEEVYDSVSDRSYFVSPTGEFSWTDPRLR